MNKLTPERLAGMIDHSFLKAFGQPADIERLCGEARAYGFAVVAVNPAEVERCARLLHGSRVGISAAIGFPLGQNTVQTKLFEIRDAIGRGATEVDMVINVRALQAGQTGIVREELGEMAAACKSSGVICKAILETCYLTEEQKRIACRLARDAGANFVKTSTGMGTAGATVEDVRLLRQLAGERMGVKAAGGVFTLDAALAMVKAGATRIGTIAGVAIIDEFRQRVAVSP